MNQTLVKVKAADGRDVASFCIDQRRECVRDLKKAAFETGCCGLQLEEMCLITGWSQNLDKKQSNSPSPEKRHSNSQGVLHQRVEGDEEKTCDIDIWELSGRPQSDEVPVEVAVGGTTRGAACLTRRYEKTPSGEEHLLVFAPVPGDGTRYAALWVRRSHRVGQVKDCLLTWLGLSGEGERYVLRSGKDTLPDEKTLKECRIQAESLLWIEPAHQLEHIPVTAEGCWWKDSVQVMVPPEETLLSMRRRILDALTWQPRLSNAWKPEKPQPETLNYWLLEKTLPVVIICGQESYPNLTHSLRDSGVNSNSEILVTRYPPWFGIYEGRIDEIVVYVHNKVLKTSECCRPSDTVTCRMKRTPSRGGRMKELLQAYSCCFKRK
ncbi:uncharacterized protein LOC122815152 [Protopterus annectens]|uniref:uncharacterized protein LOC122815152 n=1 Tax=Protopterus annectens TaxID=7888 RepID=UPI001CFA1676|nr:uncharacterized protein LOC122815152 [Protopterus annectens]